MHGSPYDSIPPGKKAQFYPETGEWKLVPIGADSVEDLRLLLGEEKARNEKLVAQIQLLMNENEKLKKKK